MGKGGSFHTCFFIENQPVKAGMTLRQADAEAIAEVYHMDRMGRDDKKQHNGREINSVLDGVHRQAGPWAGVDIAMVQLVRHLVKRRHMKQAAGEIKPDLINKRHQKNSAIKPTG